MPAPPIPPFTEEHGRFRLEVRQFIGAKTFITGVRADVLVSAVKTTAAGPEGLSFLIVERGPGVESRPLEKLGWHASDGALISFDEVPVPGENRLGEQSHGFRLVLANFQWGHFRLVLANFQWGHFRPVLANFQWERLLMSLGVAGAIEAALERAVHHARARVASQSARHQLAETAVKLQAAREVSGLERAARDARLGPIGGGTDEIMREIPGRAMGL